MWTEVANAGVDAAIVENWLECGKESDTCFGHFQTVNVGMRERVFEFIERFVGEMLFGFEREDT